MTVVPERLEVTEDRHRHGPGIDDLLAGLDELPAQRPVLMWLLSLTNDPLAAARDVAATAASDPAFCARLMRLANSAYYGLSGRVRTPAFAVTVVGFTTVRSLAMTSAAGLDDGGDLPPRFWEMATATAAAAADLAPRFAVKGPDAFCLGMLAEVGEALLHRADPEAYAEVAATSPTRRARVDAQRRRYGICGTQLTAEALLLWSFPTEMSEALSLVDVPVPNPVPAAVLIRVAVELAGRALDSRHKATPLERVTAGQLVETAAPPLVARVRDAAAALAAAFSI